MIYRVFYFPVRRFFAAFFRLCPPYLANKWRTNGEQNTEKMNITFATKLSRNGKKIWYYFEWGKAEGQRKAAHIFTFAKPKNQIEKNHNRQTLDLLETRKSELLLEIQATGSAFIPEHKRCKNFLDYYHQHVQTNQRKGNRHLPNSFIQFKAFLQKGFIAPLDITENLSLRFRQYLLDRFNGDTPANYFSHYKKVVKAATKEGYFRYSPVADVTSKTNKNKKLKDFLEAEEYIQLLRTPCYHEEVREAFIVSCYEGLRWCDIKLLDWSDIKGDQLTTQLIQAKTGEPLQITLHDLVKRMLRKRKARLQPGVTSGRVFKLPNYDGARKILLQWCKQAGIDKHITWHCARLSFSILLQDENVDKATVALLLGHTSTKYVDETYKRHRPKDEAKAIAKLPNPFTEQPNDKPVQGYMRIV